jgi:hypothetical protein
MNQLMNKRFPEARRCPGSSCLLIVVDGEKTAFSVFIIFYCVFWVHTFYSSLVID